MSDAGGNYSTCVLQPGLNYRSGSRWASAYKTSTQVTDHMRQIRQLNTAVLTALKTALDGMQRFEKEPAGPYFKTIVSETLGGIRDIDIWALRRQINEEEKRRVGSVTIRVISPGAADAIERLSIQERRVMRLTGEGHTIESIADLLSIVPRTVSNHRSNIAAKLGLGSARELLKYAHDNLTFITADPA